jgi:Circadian oscillating protein COP23
MKTIMMTQILGIRIATIGAIIVPQLAQAQVPTIVDTTPPVPQNGASTNTAAVSKLVVNCRDLKTVVKKDDQQAVMITWNTNFFGKEFTNSKRCQIVSERLQKAANQNGGTFKGLDLAIGIVNAQTVICTLPSNGEKCDRNNMLFTLKPENSSNPEAVIEQILTFAADGSGSVQEGTKSRSRVDLSLGNWERKAFKSKKPATTNPKRIKTGF